MSLSPTYFAPAQLRAGDGLDFLVAPGGYTAADGYSSVAVFVSDDGKVRLVIPGAYYGSDFRFTAGPATTRQWPVASGVLTCFAESGDDRQTVLTARLQILPDPAANPGTSTKSHARKVLDALEAVLENRATHDQQAVSIAGQSVTLMGMAELIANRDIYRAKVTAEETAQDSTGRNARRGTIEPRFSR